MGGMDCRTSGGGAKPGRTAGVAGGCKVPAVGGGVAASAPQPQPSRGIHIQGVYFIGGFYAPMTGLVRALAHPGPARGATSRHRPSGCQRGADGRGRCGDRLDLRRGIAKGVDKSVTQLGNFVMVGAGFKLRHRRVEFVEFPFYLVGVIGACGHGCALAGVDHALVIGEHNLHAAVQLAVVGAVVGHHRKLFTVAAHRNTLLRNAHVRQGAANRIGAAL